jgi:hypothetical protein
MRKDNNKNNDLESLLIGLKVRNISKSLVMRG